MSRSVAQRTPKAINYVVRELRLTDGSSMRTTLTAEVLTGQVSAVTFTWDPADGRVVQHFPVYVAEDLALAIPLVREYLDGSERAARRETFAGDVRHFGLQWALQAPMLAAAVRTHGWMHRRRLEAAIGRLCRGETGVGRRSGRKTVRAVRRPRGPGDPQLSLIRGGLARTSLRHASHANRPKPR